MTDTDRDTEDELVTLAEAPEAVESLAPSCKLVWLVLVNEDAMTHAELVEETLLSSRTVRWARNQLSDRGLVESRPSPLDARQDVFRAREEPVPIADR